MKPAKERYGWCQGEKFSKSVPEDAFEMLSDSVCSYISL